MNVVRFAKPPDFQRLGVVVVMSLDLQFPADLARHLLDRSTLHSRVNCDVGSNLLRVGNLVPPGVSTVLARDATLPVVVAFADLSAVLI